MTKDQFERAKKLKSFNDEDNRLARDLAVQARACKPGTIFQKEVSAFIEQQIKEMNDRYEVELSKI